MMTSEALYYPYTRASNDNFVKLSLLYRDKLHYIVPQEERNLFYDENRDISSFIEMHTPSEEEIKLALNRSIKVLESYKGKFGKHAHIRGEKFKYIANKKGYMFERSSYPIDENELRDIDNTGISTLLKGKYADFRDELLGRNFEEYCKKEGLGRTVDGNLLVLDDVCCIYMKELANIISNNKGLNKITDRVNLFKEIIESNRNQLGNEDINEFTIRPVIYDNMMPQHDNLENVDINDILNLKNTDDFRNNIPYLRKFMNEYEDRILNNEIGICDITYEPQESFSKFLRKQAGNNFESDVKKICTIKGIELFQNSNHLVTIATMYPALAILCGGKLEENVKGAVEESCEELITSENTKLFLKSKECLIDINNTMNIDKNQKHFRKQIFKRLGAL